MTGSTTRRSEAEFIALVALLMSLVALSIDAMLPALAAIGDDLKVVEPNDRQHVVTLFFLGLAFGQMVYGPVSDSTGRKPAMFAGLLIYAAGGLLCLLSGNFTMMLAGRFLQGLGAAGPRIVVMALVRDRFSGSAMARVMSVVMTVFILVPVIAPSLGQAILLVGHWRAIFAAFLVIAGVASIWLAFRQEETLKATDRKRFSLQQLASSTREVVVNRVAFGYTLAAGFMFSAFLGYLMSAPQVFQDIYKVEELFALYFALLALSLGGAAFVNSKLVIRFGMEKLSRWSLIGTILLSLAFYAISLVTAGQPPLMAFVGSFILIFFAVGILFGNLNARAMEPMGHIAGTAAAVIGSLTTFISLTLGSIIGAMFDQTVLPLVGGFVLFSSLSLIAVLWAEGCRSRLQSAAPEG